MKENNTKKLYNKNYLNWSRDKPICLSDFTAREKIFKLIGKLNNQLIADLGCGEGYASRIFERKGAKKVYGIDISHKMIELAKLKAKKKILYKKASITKTQLPNRLFDKTFAIFVFNYCQV
jgi:ubiquinone/menaquinone biosynthesis C-methylase UbiE